MTKVSSNKGLKNPAAALVAVEAAKQTATVIPFLIKATVIGGLGYLAYNTFVKRFRAIDENRNLPPANISVGEAQTRANSIYSAMFGFGANFNTVAENLSGLNYNGWTRLYNAFGKRKGINPISTSKDLVSWINNQFNNEQLAQLRFLLPNVF